MILTCDGIESFRCEILLISLKMFTQSINLTNNKLLDKMQLTICHPCIEKAGPELCFISHPKYERRVTCDISGNLRMSKNWKGWEVWRFTKDNDSGNFVITSWTHHHKVLCSNSKGKVYTDNKKKLLGEGKLELGEWKIDLHPKSHGVRIQSVKHGRFLAFSGENLYAMKKDEDTAWHLEPAHRNQFFISSPCHNKRLSSTKESKLLAHRNRKSWEKWVIEPTNTRTGQFTILSLEHGKYLGSSKDNKLIVSESQQRWMIGSSPHDRVFIQSVEYGGRLSFDGNGHPCTAEISGDWATLSLEPIMPTTISSKQIWSLVGIGVTTITLSVAMPFAVMGVIGAMGFEAGGIAAGSMAAGMMSGEALVSGGAIAAGGTVATLQSIGAAGLGAAGASAAAGAGAAVGGCVAAASKGLENKQEEIKLEDPGNHLPLCSWRVWE